MNFRKSLASKVSRPKWRTPVLTAVVLSATLLGGCDPTEDETLVCDEVKLLESADVNGGVTLKKDCYRIDKRLTVSDGALTLEPGVSIVFAQDAGLEISGNGRFTAKGTAENRIILTGAEKTRGYWAGLYFYQSKSSANALDHVVIEYAGSTKWHGGDSKGGVYVRGDGVALSITNSVFRENAFAGVYADNGGAELSVASSAFEKNAVPLWIAANLAGNLADDNTFSDNDASYVHASVGGTGSGGLDVKTSQTWVALSVPYRVHGTIVVSSDLKLLPGVTIEFEQDAGLFINNGTLSADGTGGDRIKFIAADGEKVRGFWAGIAFEKSLSSKNKIANADIHYAGGKKWHGGTSKAGIFLRGGTDRDSQLRLSDVDIAGSGSYGLLIEAGSTVDPCDDVTFDNNVDDDISGAGTTTCQV